MTKIYKVLIIASITISIIIIALSVILYSEFRVLKAKTESFKRLIDLELLKHSQEINTDTVTSIEDMRSDMKQEIKVIKDVVKRLNKQVMETTKKEAQ